MDKDQDCGLEEVTIMNAKMMLFTVVKRKNDFMESMGIVNYMFSSGIMDYSKDAGAPCFVVTKTPKKCDRDKRGSYQEKTVQVHGLFFETSTY